MRMKWNLKSAAALLAASPLVSPAFANEGAVPKGVPRLDHVFVIMMENHGYKQIIGNPNAPFANQLAKHATWLRTTSPSGIPAPRIISKPSAVRISACARITIPTGTTPTALPICRAASRISTPPTAETSARSLAPAPTRRLPRPIAPTKFSAPLAIPILKTTLTAFYPFPRPATSVARPLPIS